MLSCITLPDYGLPRAVYLRSLLFLGVVWRSLALLEFFSEYLTLSDGTDICPEDSVNKTSRITVFIKLSRRR